MDITQLPTAKLTELYPLQDDLKFLSGKNKAKLQRSIERYGFIVPVFTYWDGERRWLLDGHQRHALLSDIDPKAEIPYYDIQAKDLQDARELLLNITSQYGHITQEGLEEFITAIEDYDAGLYNFDGVFTDMEDNTEAIEEEPEPVEHISGEAGGGNQIKSIQLRFDDADYREIMDFAIEEVNKGAKDMSEVVLTAVRKYKML